jgi:hypothetical protein
MSPYCTNCGSEVEDSWNACPNCGKTLKEAEIPQLQPQQQPQAPVQPQVIQTQPYHRTYSSSWNNNYGSAALIIGIIGLFCGISYAGLVLGIAAIILGGLGISRDENNALAMIGIVLGILDFVCFLFFYFWLSSLFNWLSWFENFW